jgi:hypothetical protein
MVIFSMMHFGIRNKQKFNLNSYLLPNLGYLGEATVNLIQLFRNNFADHIPPRTNITHI